MTNDDENLNASFNSISVLHYYGAFTTIGNRENRPVLEWEEWWKEYDPPNIVDGMCSLVFNIARETLFRDMSRR